MYRGIDSEPVVRQVLAAASQFGITLRFGVKRDRLRQVVVHADAIERVDGTRLAGRFLTIAVVRIWLVLVVKAEPSKNRQAGLERQRGYSRKTPGSAGANRVSTATGHVGTGSFDGGHLGAFDGEGVANPVTAVLSLDKQAFQARAGKVGHAGKTGIHADRLAESPESWTKPAVPCIFDPGC